MKKFFIHLLGHILILALCFLSLIASNTNSGVPLFLLLIGLLFFDVIICPIAYGVSNSKFYLYNFFVGIFLIFLVSVAASFSTYY